MLGTSVLWAGVPAALADEPTPAQPAATERSQPKSAAERWNRLKTQYASPAAEPTAKAGTTAKAEPATKAKPDRDKVQPAAAVSPAAASTAISEKPSGTLQWRLPEGDDPFASAAPATVKQTAAVAQDADVPAPAVEPPAVPPPAAPAAEYENLADTQTPDEAAPFGNVNPREIHIEMHGGTPRKTTQIRRMADIAPLNDFNKETEIQKYAAEKAREFNVRFGGDAYTAREFPDVALPWAPPNSCYYPLYFQDPALERYGHSHHPLLQPVVSSARMSAQLVMMPYQMTITPPWEMHSPLGYYRPGDVVPKIRYPFPWNTKAALVEAGSVLGFIYLIP